ncbi:ribonucleoside-diphosphate reductase class Ib glutaredoxin subunit [Paracoccus lutimaris]|uniref:Glutaredoxin-like protein NrdH n=2 Tax=Paracoccus lutimaris TaxID=1490030 RepID=A0A368Z3W5_9RHOB|nr:ribonucleoside-diphosphate reductase class Ib glutaredoxin subunit [Paracoccus lutimaris]
MARFMILSDRSADSLAAGQAEKTRKGQAMTITVYSKPACVQCTATTRALEARGLAYQLIDLTEDDDAMELVTSMGYRQAPVVVAGEAHWAGFRPDMIGSLA